MPVPSPQATLGLMLVWGGGRDPSGPSLHGLQSTYEAEKHFKDPLVHYMVHKYDKQGMPFHRHFKPCDPHLV